MFCNWGVEARKWQLLIATDEKISWSTSLQSIFAGVTMSIFTPNRVGEFAGRIFFLKEMNKVKASMRSAFGSFMQLLITLIAGCFASLLYIKKEYNNLVPLQSFLDPDNKWMLFTLVLIVIAIIYAIVKFPYFLKWRHYLAASFKIPRKQFFQTLFLSAIRYFVFTMQFYLMLLAIGIEIDCLSAFMLIAVTFLMTSIIPSFALTEIVVRSAVAVSVFAATGQAEMAATASFFLWVINLAIPAVLGSLFMGKLQFFKA
jgi:uncharacterized membrane protein YbhN (UPF0104 family)